MMTTLILIETASALVIAWQAIAHLNSMSHCTDLRVRLVWLAVAVSSVAVLLGPLAGHGDDRWAHALMLVGVAVLAVFDRRKTYHSGRRRHDRGHHA